LLIWEIAYEIRPDTAPGFCTAPSPGGEWGGSMTLLCRACGAPAAPAGTRFGTFARRDFSFARCRGCGFAFVVDPLEDLGALYDEAYYRGQGADPLVNYLGELEAPERSIRVYEWRGILKAIEALRGPVGGLRWLDYGCGTGGLVRHVRGCRALEMMGYEQGWAAEKAHEAGIPVLDSAALAGLEGSCDIVTAIEVIEHIVDPHELLTAARRLLKPGGLLFLSTGNSAPVTDLTRWYYAEPEAHVSFFEPRTPSMLMERHGFRAARRGFLPGYDDIIRFKVLMTLKQRRRSVAEALLPWPVLARVIDRLYHVTAHPIGWAV
jgi:SAM-dependent methyltransferase